MEEISKSFKTVIVGDGAVGKTCLACTFRQNRFPKEYVPTVFDNYQETVKSGGVDYEIQLWDTAGQEEFKKLRVLSYEDAQCFMICFSLVNRTSFNNIREKWFPDLAEKGQNNVPIIIVGCKNDLRKDDKFCRQIIDEEGEDYRPVDDEEAYDMAREIGAFRFIKTSAKTRENVREAFQVVVDHLVLLRSKKRKKKKKKGGLSGLSAGISIDDEDLSGLMSLSQARVLEEKKKKKKDIDSPQPEDEHDWVKKSKK